MRHDSARLPSAHHPASCAAIARMLGATAQGQLKEASQQADEAYKILGIPADLVVRMDSASLAKLYPQADKLRLLSKLLWQQAESLRASKDPVNGLDRQRRAVELLLEAQQRAPIPEDASNLQEMFRHVPTAILNKRYQYKDGISS